uniref:Uncharacterized protein n=1 Tax=Amphimedon queenslandica TaxID=400682 RepID=A0A1X7UX22_AMPQE
MLNCLRETSNLHDPYTVATVKDGVTVGHVPHKISALCSLFPRRQGSISCTVTGRRQRSADLVQCGLEIPCTLHFAGDKDSIDKIKQLLAGKVDVVIDTEKGIKENIRQVMQLEMMAVQRHPKK